VNLDEYTRHDALSLAQMVRTRQVTPRELIEAARMAAERVEPQINALSQRLFDRALDALSPVATEAVFGGVPFLLKDVTAQLAGTRTGAGSRLMRDAPPADRDSELVARYRRAGVLFVGKTTTPEFGAQCSTEVDETGITRNPWDPRRSSGGSSGGAGAAVAAGIVPMAHAGDGGGSLRIPAACCGLFGLKPTRQRLPTGPDSGDHFYGFSVSHVVSRSVRDSAAMLDATCGADVGAPYWAPPPNRPYLEELSQKPQPLRIAVAAQSFGGEPVDPACEAAVWQAATLCRELGHEVEEAQPKFDRDEFGEALRAYLFGGIAFAVDEIARQRGLSPVPPNIERLTHLLAEDGRRRSATDFIRAGQYLGVLGRIIGRFFEEYDVLLTPSLAQLPAPIGYIKNDTDTVEDYLAKANAYLPFQPLFNATGQPAANVPLFEAPSGLPVGVQFAARFGDEATIFRLSAQLEAARPWFHRRPVIHAAH
jgi:amidase